QAKGVDGKSTPHESFEEMAASYLAEMRLVQPEGPYYLGGFSGGGIVAYEIARQLRAGGEKVGCLVLLDTWLPQEKLLSYEDRRSMHKQRFEQQGLKYAGGIVWNRLMRNKKRMSQIVNSYLGRVRPYEFSESNVELAFRRALVRYDTPRWAEDVILFRPKLDVAHVLPSGNWVNSRANYVWEDNGWSQYVDGQIEVVEVPGDHDSMVLEPQVRVLADRLRAVLIEAERTIAASDEGNDDPKGALRGSAPSPEDSRTSDPSELRA
ncbi:MAG: thioesterase domain-containing protein, partial [Planctomycetota bacterium]